MKVTEISVSKDVTVGVGKFESVRIGVTMKATVEETDQSRKPTWFRGLWDLADAQINEQIAELQQTIKPDSVFRLEKTQKPRRTT